MLNGRVNSKMLDYFTSMGIEDFKLNSSKYFRNRFGVYIDNHIAGSVLLFESSGFNHSCTPNIDYFITEDSNYKLTMWFVAMNNIQEGDSLSSQLQCIKKKSIFVGCLWI